MAVGSRDGDRATAFAAANGIARAHGSYEALLADPEVDAVYISLPNGLHHGWTMHALAAGKHVLCEKPYTRHPEEVDEAFDAAEAAGSSSRKRSCGAIIRRSDCCVRWSRRSASCS